MPEEGETLQRKQQLKYNSSVFSPMSAVLFLLSLLQELQESAEREQAQAVQEQNKYTGKEVQD